MKRITLLTSMVLMSMIGFSQAVSCDLSLSGAEITDASGNSLDANMIAINQVVGVKVTVGNFVSGNTAPSGHFRIRIGLGNGLQLNPGYNLATAPQSNFFSFTYDLSGSQPQIIGNSIAPLPDGYAGELFFQLRGTMSTTSTVSFNLLISNPQGTTTPLSDPSPSNNSAANTYTVTSVILPVTFAGISATVKDCNVNLEWNVKGQTNLSHYEVEVSKDGTTYSKVNEVIVRNTEKYNLSIQINEGLKSPILYFRVKSVDKDGTFKYSEVRSVKGQCDKSRSFNVSLYPNPVSYSTFVTITSTDGTFDGKYKAVLLDKGGKVYQSKDVELNNVKNFKFNFGNIAAGSYNVMLMSADESRSAVLEFTKL